MPDTDGRCLVTNTTPLIALTAATGGLEVLRFLYERVIVHQGFVVDIPQALDCMRRQGIWLSDQVVRFALSN